MPPNRDKRPDPAQFVYENCSVVLGYEEVTDSKIAIIITRAGGISFTFPSSASEGRVISPNEMDSLLSGLPPSEMKDALEKQWKKVQELPS